MDVLLETHPPPPLETSRTLSMFILQVLRLSVLYKSIKVHLGQSQKLIMSIEIYLKRKYSYENAGFCTLWEDDFKILKIFVKLSKFSSIFHLETSHAPTPPPPSPPQNVHMTFLVDKIDMSRFPKLYKLYKFLMF